MSAGKVTKLNKGVVRQDLAMADGRQIFYYDKVDGSAEISRTAVDARAKESRPGVGELRLDALTNEWVAMAAHRQTRAFLRPKNYARYVLPNLDLNLKLLIQITKLLSLKIGRLHLQRQTLVGRCQLMKESRRP